jgi:hypothetical protein
VYDPGAIAGGTAAQSRLVVPGALVGPLAGEHPLGDRAHDEAVVVGELCGGQ